ncbi:MAG: glycosyltransferase [Bryobacteraceae bacterium]
MDPIVTASKRIVLTPWGSFGDLHPFLALAIELKRRGHRPVIATCSVYREKVEGEGITFAPMRPDVGELQNRPDLVQRIFHPLRGSEYIIRELLMPVLGESVEDVNAAAEGADLLISHSVTFATPLVAETRRLPWLSVVLQPSVMFSELDPPRMPQLRILKGRGPVFKKLFFSVMRCWTRRWFKPYDRLRHRLGLPPAQTHPLFKGQFSPNGTIALFSELFGKPQPDWPPWTTVTGFPFYDRFDAGTRALSPELATFLDEGPEPIVFTLGSSAVFDPGTFFDISAEAARSVGRRAVLLAGLEYANRVRLKSDDGMLICAYEPHSLLFPRAAAIVHQGGIGTTAQALRSGKPMLVVAFSHDQPDNGARVEEMSVGLTMSRDRYNIATAIPALESLLKDDAMRNKASETGRQIRAEHAVDAACDVIEETLRTTPI